jgi:hypothetical protein
MGFGRLEGLESLESLKKKPIIKVRGSIIGKINYIEHLLALIIGEYFKTDKKDEFENILMNTTYFNYGKKIRLLRSLKLIKEREFELFHRISVIRNTFAHANLSFDDESMKIDKREKLVLITISRTGKLKKEGVYELAHEFEQSVNYIEKIIENIIRVKLWNEKKTSYQL